VGKGGKKVHGGHISKLDPHFHQVVGNSIVDLRKEWYDTYTPLVDRTHTRPEQFQLSSKSKDYILERGVREWTLDTMPIHNTTKGILFEFPAFPYYWQERRWQQFRPPPWDAPSGPAASKGVVYEVQGDPNDNRCFLVEGVFDALVVGSYANAAATLSWRLHVEQLNYLAERYKKLVYMPDGSVSMANILGEYNKMPKGSEFVCLPPGKDPADLKEGITKWLG
jgi:hypothetical protein